MSEDPPLSADERAELERLRAENAALRARAGPGGAGPTPAAGPAARRRWRTAVGERAVGREATVAWGRWPR
jgi:hypothetical protein